MYITLSRYWLLKSDTSTGITIQPCSKLHSLQRTSNFQKLTHDHMTLILKQKTDTPIFM